MTVEAISSQQDSNRTSLEAWASYSAQVHAKLDSPAQRVTVAPVRQATLETEATLKTQATLETKASLHAPGCTCSTCLRSGLSTSGTLVGKATVVKIKLNGELTPEEKRMLEELKRRDAQVKRHEQAHLAAAGRWALGPPRYTYQVGPDGQRYAVGGEVRIDMSPIPGDPEATLRKARQLQQAALAPMDPSATDRQVAMQAAEMAQEARRELQEQRQEEAEKAREDEQKDAAYQAHASAANQGQRPNAENEPTASAVQDLDSAQAQDAAMPSTSGSLPNAKDAATAADDAYSRHRRAADRMSPASSTVDMYV